MLLCRCACLVDLVVYPPTGSRPITVRWVHCLHCCQGVWYHFSVFTLDFTAGMIIWRLISALKQIPQLGSKFCRPRKTVVSSDDKLKVCENVSESAYLTMCSLCDVDVPHQQFVHKQIGQWMPYNFAVEGFHTKKLCSRLSSRKVQFSIRKTKKLSPLRPPLGS